MSKPLPTIEDYLALIPSQHSDKPKFVALFTAIANSYIAVQGTIAKFVSDFDVNLAIGVQLDKVGLWVGLSRALKEPIPGIFFTYDSETVGETYDTGVWPARYENTDTMYLMPDPLYRLAIKFKIMSNNWDGSIPGLYKIWNTVLGNSEIDLYVQDNQDMTFDIYLVSSDGFTEAEKAIIQNSGLFPKPAGVSINYIFTETPPI